MPKRIEKTLDQFEQEIETLEATWGLRIGRATILATVSHQHIYGLLFRVLWPLMTGRCFDACLYRYPDQLLTQIQRRPSSVLISSPAHRPAVSIPVVKGMGLHHAPFAPTARGADSL